VDVDFKNQTKLLNAFCGHKADYKIKVGVTYRSCCTL